jgi:CMP-N-acetylneuraminic acid synthetase
MASPKVSVIITAYNYAEYIEKALDSVLNQTFDNFELVVVDDGSTDNTPEILREYSYEHSDKVRVVTLDGMGLAGACNRGIEASAGEYIIRLDADDYLDENTLTIESRYLDSNQGIDLVYPDYYTVDKEGEIIDHVRLPKVNEEVKLLDRSPLAAGAMYRKEAWEEIGGYNETLQYQEDYDFWVKFISTFNVHNINLPLMYYRQHSSSMSTNFSERMNARRDVKQEFINKRVDTDDVEVLGVIPARGESRINPPDFEDTINSLALSEIAGRPLIEYSVKEASASEHIDQLIVSTENEDIAEVSRAAGAEVPFIREKDLSDPGTQLWEVVASVLRKRDEVPDLVAVLPYVTPLRTAEQIDEAINTSIIFSVDSVISVCENKKFLWQPGKFGLEPLFEKRLLRRDRETTYQENGAIYVTKPETIRNQSELIGQHVGHILMQEKNSVHIDSWFDYTKCADAVSRDLVEFVNKDLIG